MDNRVQEKKKEWSWVSHKPNNVFNIVATPDKDFYKWWCVLLRPFVNLTPKEINVVASFLKYRMELMDRLHDSEIVDTLLMGNDIKDKVIKDCNITPQHFYVVMSTLRKKHVITTSGINPRLIPNKNDDGIFQLLILIKDKQ